MTPAKRFDAAAATYEAATPIQRQIASALADRIAAVTAPGCRVAEFGCGIGYLAQDLLERLAPSLWLATDIAPAMLSMLAQRLRHQALLTAVIDANNPPLDPGFDLVCSSLTLQWLACPAQVARRWRALVRPGGVLAIATLVEGSFAEWREALSASRASAPEPEPTFPALSELKTWFGPQARIEALTLVERHDSALAFARAARAAGVDGGSHRALDGAAMRRALTALDAAGASITYQAAMVIDRV